MGHTADILLAKLEKCFLCIVSSSHWIVTILKTVRKSDFTRHKNTHKASYITYIFHASKLTLNSLWYKILPSRSNFFELPAFSPYPKFYYKRVVTSNSDNNPFCSFSSEQVKVQEVWTLILIFFSECYTCAKPTFVKLIWGTIHIYQRLKYIGSCSKMIKRGRLLKQGESRVTAQEIYLKVSPARLLSFLELFNKEKENQKLERFWKTSEREKKILWCFKSWFWMIAWTLI